ncbi:MAG TPA: 16S rRNA (adenine(1518)-N(6)/adenine(1519)-N(6))-dimethyltransferase RsmA [Bacilli bacterium]|jgi:16S rRNA (adenine1518-N6/adenine1519-N6)-dimethyltransferase|nr:ribosomal RNA small subunit methyltransferase A [Acholeplasmataceae bacterium]HNZ78017.1 16S rRNA (adenine(1518)-N(6)/adenine(1519)-N(6))-dimethyltransferase RsmA [Bacilli bacterium]HOD61003.1 16S rRNA (adenine(1518)-N(6)/adenine(1519)-N(6))-dimethyltransferase RsmA [Bacilli bacterium]HOH60861.1 16S rRNA (adenine(1518)-N(6)/adenine(1519)-N(6))-dimethyltransferase RsmA [Bacilli bacterium]HPB48801.1 16S rRNA (adenine(1518)-N(6)/adenine(1519)-N(6))-dimethyltransferase RsmA [Bacilli bacterium]
MIGSITETKRILDKYNLQAKKKLGQNFLVDGNIIHKIIDQINLSKEDGVVEIGPGIGAMTEILLRQAEKVLCYEIDKDMVEVLSRELTKGNLLIKQEDFLKADLISDLKNFKVNQRIVVVSNLPYYITTPIIFKLLEEETSIEEFYFMVQKEVGLRLTGKPKTKDYNSLSVLISFQAEANLLFEVKRNSFYPVPDVDSVIISLKKTGKDYGVNNRDKFIEFVQNIFAMRRKTIINNLMAKYSFSRKELVDIMSSQGHKETLRAEELSVKEIVELYKAFVF